MFLGLVTEALGSTFEMMESETHEDTMFLNTLSAKSLSGTDESITQLNSCRLLTVSNLKTQCF